MAVSVKKLTYLKNIFLKADFIGPQFSLEHNDTTRFQSWQGFSLSTIVITVCTTLAFMFGQEIYRRKTPIVSISQEFVQYSDVWMKEFPLMFSFILINGTSLTFNNFEQYIEPSIYMASMDEKGLVHEPDKFFKFQNCNPNRYIKYSDIVKEKITLQPDRTFLCMDHDDLSNFSNTYFAANSTNLNFVLKNCNASRSGKLCADEDEIAKTVENMLVTITYVTSFVDFYNFTNPVFTYMDEMTTQASNFLTRRSYLRFVYNAFESDNGILLEDKTRTEFIYLNSIVPDDLNKVDKGPNKDVLFWLSLESPKLRNLTARNYMKVQDLLAKIGGIANAIIILVRLLSYHYLRYLYLFNIKEVAIDAVIQNELEQSVLNNLYDSKLHTHENQYIDRRISKRHSTLIQVTNVKLKDNFDRIDFKGDKNNSKNKNPHMKNNSHIKNNLN